MPSYGEGELEEEPGHLSRFRARSLSGRTEEQSRRQRKLKSIDTYFCWVKGKIFARVGFVTFKFGFYYAL